MRFQRVYSGAPWEARVGYCRALRAGNLVFVTGTVALEPDGSVHAPGDGYAQATRCLQIIADALAGLDAGPEHVVRTRMFVTDIDRWEEFGNAHSQFFGEAHPTTTMVEVSRLMHPDMLIEIEADAVAPPPTPTRS